MVRDAAYELTDAEKRDLIKTANAVKKVVGKAPTGYLSTGVAPSAVRMAGPP